MHLVQLGDLLQEISSVGAESAVVQEVVVGEAEPIHILERGKRGREGGAKGNDKDGSSTGDSVRSGLFPNWCFPFRGTP